MTDLQLLQSSIVILISAVNRKTHNDLESLIETPINKSTNK
jgi:hypothetical protein